MTPTFGNRWQIVLGIPEKWRTHLNRQSLQALRRWGIMYDPAIDEKCDEKRRECSWMTLPWRNGEPGTLHDSAALKTCL